MATKSPNVSQADSQPSPPAKPPRRSLFARSSSKPGPKKKENNSAPPSPHPNPINPANPSQSAQSSNSPGSPSSQVPPSAPATSPPSPPPTTSPDGQIKSDPATSNLAASSQQGPVPATSQAPAEQASAQPTKTSTTTVASLPGTSTSSALPHPTSEPADDADREKEKDKGSLSTTLTGTHHTRVSRKGAQTSSEGAHSSTAAEKPPSLKSAAKRRVPKPQSSSPRVSFISRLFRSLVPCVGPSHLPNEAIDDVVSDPNSSATALRDKSARDAEKDPSLRPVQETPVTNGSESDQPHPGTETTSLPLVPAAELAPRQLNVTLPEPTTPDNNLDIVVPPTPTKVIPESETGGVTSSAVVPPGSTAEEVAQLRAQQAHEPSSGDESDGTSFTEDEEVEDVPGIDEAEDDEDRLILSGGAGIPIGPVSATTSLLIGWILICCQSKDGVPRPLLPPISPQHAGRKCLVLDLDETLVHSSFKVRYPTDYNRFSMLTLFPSSRSNKPTTSCQSKSSITGTTSTSLSAQEWTIF